MEGVLPLGGYPAVVKDTSTQSRYTTTHIVEDTNSSCAISSAQNLESFISTPSVAKYGGNLPFDIRPSLSSPTAQETPASDTETMDIDTDYDLDDSTVRSERLSSTPHTMTQGPSPAGSMEFQCSVCSMGFRNTTNLKRHERSVHGDKVPCVWCHKPGRNRPDYIKKHQGTCKKKPRGSGTMGGRS